MKKVITIMCLAAAPIMFAQQKSIKSSTKESVQVEQQMKIDKKAQQVEANKKADAEKAKKKQVNATSQNKNVSREATLEANPVKTEKK